ncbi:MAG TPA: T9SS type A sorting domain-containing protein [Bacteroidia bacterium]|jgi:hypothetical protein|nr:T9SS type A sorting domain-containing protein [Bacteroidia bacterium]
MIKKVKILLTSSLVAFTSIFYSQTNLVPNPSFESYDACPTNQNQVYHAIGWSSYRQAPAYLNACASQFSGVSVPNNVCGYQYAATGSGYMALYTYFPSSADNREYIGCILNAPLVIGTKYYVTLKTSLCNIDSALWYNTATDHLGIRFSTIPYSFSSPAPINNFAQVYSTTIIKDTLNWIKISGSFVADSIYKYLAIGNFFDNVITNKFFFYTGSNYAAAYFIDDVCVSTDSNFCSNWTGIKENNSFSSILIYPNPFLDFTTIDLVNTNEEPVTVILYNVSGQIIKTYEGIKAEKLIIKTENLPAGIYFLKIADKNGHINKHAKIIRQ